MSYKTVIQIVNIIRSSWFKKCYQSPLVYYLFFKRSVLNFVQSRTADTITSCTAENVSFSVQLCFKGIISSSFSVIIQQPVSTLEQILQAVTLCIYVLSSFATENAIQLFARFMNWSLIFAQISVMRAATVSLETLMFENEFYFPDILVLGSNQTLL